MITEWKPNATVKPGDSVIAQDPKETDGPFYFWTLRPEAVGEDQDRHTRTSFDREEAANWKRGDELPDFA